jgi:hypothetical protein
MPSRRTYWQALWFQHDDHVELRRRNSPFCGWLEKTVVSRGAAGMLSRGRNDMRLGVATMLFSIGLVSIHLGAGAAHAADECGPGCHSAVNGACVVDGWETGAPVWNECPAGSHPRPPCDRPYSWRKHAKTCLLVN